MRETLGARQTRSRFQTIDWQMAPSLCTVVRSVCGLLNLKRRGQRSEASPLAREAMQAMTETLGAHHPITILYAAAQHTIQLSCYSCM